MALFDGQNLFHAAKEQFGYSFPNYDPFALAAMVCNWRGWQLVEARFYTGVPDIAINRFWNIFWNNKIRAMKRRGVKVFQRMTRERTREAVLDGSEVIRFPGQAPLPAGTTLHLADGSVVPSGTEIRVRMGVEKGIDVLIAVDMIRQAHSKAYDALILFSQDQDLAEAVTGVFEVAREQGRRVELASAYPDGPGQKGINMTKPIPINKADSDPCIDKADYRPTS